MREHQTRWEKDAQFIAIESALSAEYNAEVLIVSSSLSWGTLPLELKEQVRKSDAQQCEALQNAVAYLAHENGFLPTEA